MSENISQSLKLNLGNTLINEIINKLDGDDLYSIVLFSSYARNEAKQFSDIDIICYSKMERHSRPVRQILLTHVTHLKK